MYGASMIDLQRLRQEPELVIGLLKKKDPSFDGIKLYELDEQVRKIRTEVEELRNKKNELAEQGKKGLTPELREQSKEVGAHLKEKEHILEIVLADFKKLYLHCPNIIMDSVPEGNKEENLVVKTHGEKPSFTFTPKNHVELGEKNKWFDFEAASRMAASNFALYKGDAVKIVYRLMLFMLNNAIKHGYSPVLPPYLINEKTLEGAGNFPRFQEEAYAVTKIDSFSPQLPKLT